MKEMDPAIDRFIRAHHLMMLATSDDAGIPYATPLFYAYDRSQGTLVFTSAATTLHAHHLQERAQVGAAIASHTRRLQSIRGVQLCGSVRKPDSPQQEARAKQLYLQRFPFAASFPLELWLLEIAWIKYTDNGSLFGEKTIWRRDDLKA